MAVARVAVLVISEVEVNRLLLFDGIARKLNHIENVDTLTADGLPESKIGAETDALGVNISSENSGEVSVESAVAVNSFGVGELFFAGFYPFVVILLQSY